MRVGIRHDREPPANGCGFFEWFECVHVAETRDGGDEADIRPDCGCFPRECPGCGWPISAETKAVRPVLYG